MLLFPEKKLGGNTWSLEPTPARLRFNRSILCTTSATPTRGGFDGFTFCRAAGEARTTAPATSSSSAPRTLFLGTPGARTVGRSRKLPAWRPIVSGPWTLRRQSPSPTRTKSVRLPALPSHQALRPPTPTPLLCQVVPHKRALTTSSQAWNEAGEGRTIRRRPSRISL